MHEWSWWKSSGRLSDAPIQIALAFFFSFLVFLNLTYVATSGQFCFKSKAPETVDLVKTICSEEQDISQNRHTRNREIF